MTGHYFETPHLIAAYSGERFIGIFITYPQETVTVEDLDNHFYIANATCFVAEEIPVDELDEDLTPDNYIELLADMIEAYMDHQLSELPTADLIFMPKTLH